MGEWKVHELGNAPLEIIDGDRGKNYPSQNEFCSSGYCLFLSTKNVRINGFDFSDCQYISKEKDELLRKGKLQKNDIVLTTRGTVGNIGFFDSSVTFENMRINSGMVIIRPDNLQLDSTFNFYLFRKLQNDFYTFTSGSAQPQLPIRDLKKMEILLPPLEEQKAIAGALSSLDDKIDLLHRQNKTLEELAQTLFRQWFIEEAKDEWEEVALGEVIETTSGGTPSRSKMEFYEDGTIEWIKSKELSGSFILSTEEKITAQALKSSSAKLLPKHSILIAMYGATVGEYAIISKEMTCNQAICALKPNEKYPYTFLFMFVKNYKEEIINMAVGSAQQNISQQLIKTLPVPTCFELINNFHKQTESLFEKILSNIKQIQTLNNLRDTLLPKLMSGEVRVNI
jgi:type I restriction enzyme S subunit